MCFKHMASVVPSFSYPPIWTTSSALERSQVPDPWGPGAMVILGLGKRESVTTEYLLCVGTRLQVLQEKKMTL